MFQPQLELPPCEVCGGTDYNKQSGFYICKICDVQSQEIIDESLNCIGESSANVVVDEDKLSEVSEGRKLTSWEVYNFILKGSLNEIIQLGAPDEVRIVALQLWVQYLQRCGAAFISKDVQKYPKLPAGFKNKDARILYGVKNLRKKIAGDLYPNKCKKQRRAEDDESENSGESKSSKMSIMSVSKWMRKQRNLAGVLNKTDLSDTPVSETESLRTLGSKSSKKKRSVTLKFGSNAEKRLCQMLTTAANCKHADDDKKDKIRSKNNTRQYFYNKSKKPGRKDSLTMSTIISIIRISLLMIGHNNIQLSDLLRWIREGKLSMTKPELFLPSGENYRYSALFNAQRSGLQTDLLNTAKYLGLKNIQAPNLYYLVERYCKELHLPKRFLKKVHSLMRAYPPAMEYLPSSKSNFPDYECRAISYIIFTAKLLFGLNDYSEYKYSDLASNVNRYYEENHIKKRKLFSWREWTRYIECRNAVLSKFSVIQNDRYYDGRLCNEYNFSNYWNRASSLLVVKTLRADKVMRSMSRAMSKFSKNENNEFPIATAHEVDDINHLLDTMSHLVPKSAVKILRRDFSKHSIMYLMDDDRCRQACLDCGIDLEITSSDLSFKQCVQKKLPLTSVLKSKTQQVLPSFVNISVVLEETEVLPCSTSKLSKFKCESKKINCDSMNNSDPADNDSVEMTFPKFEYWVFHEVFRNMTNEEFQKISDLFPNSFSWLLKLCSTIVDIQIKDIYFELVNIEVILYKKFVDKKYKPKGWRISPDQW